MKESSTKMFDGVPSRITAISRTISILGTTSSGILQILEDQCSIVGCSFEKTSELLVEMYPIFYFNFNAGGFTDRKKSASRRRIAKKK